MASKDWEISKKSSGTGYVPFDSAEEVWFWFMRAQEAKNDGARFSASIGTMPRPCEPLDILRILDRLYRNRRLLKDHLMVLRHYGKRDMSPDPCRDFEAKAHRLWAEAMERIEPILEEKGIVKKSHFIPRENWQVDAYVFNGGAQSGA